MKVVNWNLEWARPGCPRGREIARRISEIAPDLVCLTEAFADIMTDGFVVTAGTGNAVADRKGAHKVLLWSRWRLRSLRTAGYTPPGRNITAIIEDGPFAGIQVCGVCIPWRGSGSPRLGGASAPWEDHLRFLETLRSEIATMRSRSVVIGDFNQRLPRKNQPIQVWRAIEETFRSMCIATRGLEEPTDGMTIDHIAHSPDLVVTDLRTIARLSHDLILSDHFGITASVKAA